jgi:hypothetical protein
MQLYVAKNNQQHGPYSVAELQQHLASGTFNLADLGWQPGLAGWQPLNTFPDLTAGAPQPPPIPSTLVYPETSGLAIASLVLGVLCFISAGLTSLPAIICGHRALSQIKKSAGRVAGQSMAVVGLVMGYIFLVLFAVAALAIVAGIALPVFGAVRERSLDAKSLANGRSIALACRLYADDHGGNFPPDLAALVPDYVPDLAALTSPRAPDKTDVGYEYTPGLNVSDPPGTVLLRDKFPSRQINRAFERRAVIHLDGQGEIERTPANLLK